MKTEDLTNSTSQAVNRLKDFQQVAGEKAKQLSIATDDYVHDNPWKTIAIAALAGCIIGFLMRTRE